MTEVISMGWNEIGLPILVFVIIVAILLISLFIARGVYHPLHFSLEQTRAKEMERTPDLLKEYDRWEKRPYWIHSRFGYDLKTYFLPTEKNDGPIKKFVVIAHGYTYSHHGSIKYAWLMKKFGYNVIIYDERYHAESGGKTCTLGYYEQFDLEDVISDTFHRYGSDLFLGTYGESMGATTALLEQGFDHRLKFVIADCGFSDLRDLLTYICKSKYHLPRFPFIPLAGFFYHLATKARMKDVRPIAAVAKATQPILFIHGKDDRFIPYRHSEMMYEACPTAKHLFIAGNDAHHAESFRKNREEYEKNVTEFMTKNQLF